MTDHCMLCGSPLLHGEAQVEISAEPYLLSPGGPAHLDCASSATRDAIAAQQDAADAWFSI